LAIGLVIAVTTVVNHSFFDDATAQQESDGATVRISALKSESGAVRVALQQQGVGGSWGERQHPGLNTVGAMAPTGIWLNSSPLRIEAPPVDDGPLFCITAHGRSSDHFWRLLRGFSRQSALDQGMNVRFSQATEGADQAAQIDQCVSDGASVIASTLANPEAVRPSLLAARDAGVRIITFNSGAEHAMSVGSELHIALDDAEAGRIAGEEFNRRGVVGPIGCLIHETENSGLETRCNELEAAYQGGDIARIQLPTSVDSSAVRSAIVERLLDDAQPELVALLALNGDTLFHALSSVIDTEELFEHRIKVASVGLNLELARIPIAVREPFQEFYINAAPEAQGYLITAALQMVHDYTVPAWFIRQPLILNATPFVYAVEQISAAPDTARRVVQRILGRLALGEEYFD